MQLYDPNFNFFFFQSWIDNYSDLSLSIMEVKYMKNGQLSYQERVLEVNTTKLTKRIMYGKSSFELIKKRLWNYSLYFNNHRKEPIFLVILQHWNLTFVIHTLRYRFPFSHLQQWQDISFCFSLSISYIKGIR